eukprot:TRINITY_DN6044_c0_g1_i1.p1 TRINITY_DN6044_c0_g1~~TRINITY_DN6044_c0_g1_i1.p1  ORF type:complete len:263 (-),score=43.63 TRINITY_DN6044_c0_g1_i1:55-843(-)
MILVVIVSLLFFTVESQSPVYTYEILENHPHDTTAYTEGLQIVDGVFYESTGMRGHSTLRTVEFDTGNVIEEFRLDDIYFGEGCTVMKSKIFQLTWLSMQGFVYDQNNFTKGSAVQFVLPFREGWGLTNDGTNLLMSNGSQYITVVDPSTFAVKNIFAVIDPTNNQPVTGLNELEYNFEKQLIYANIYPTDNIVIFTPTGRVVFFADLSGLLQANSIKVGRQNFVDVLNGIAFDSNNRLVVTGKYWPKVFVLNLIQKQVVSN